MVRSLIKGQILGFREEQDDELLLPLMPAETLNSREIVEMIFGCEQLPTEGGLMAGQAVAAASSALNDRPVFTAPHSRECRQRGSEAHHS